MKRNENYLEDAFKMFLAGTDKEKILNYLEEQNELNKTIPVKCWRENKNIPLPIYAHDGDACCDLYAQAIEYDDSRDRYIVHTGLHIALDEDYECELRPRSSLVKTEYYIANTPGTIDEPYRGEIMVVFKCRDNIKFIDAIDSIGSVVGKLVKEETEEYHDMVDCGMYFRDAKEQLNFPYKVGDRIAQILVHKRTKIEWKEVNSLEELGQTDRGKNGYGSTGR